MASNGNGKQSGMSNEYNEFVSSAIENLERLPQWARERSGIDEMITAARERMAARQRADAGHS